VPTRREILLLATVVTMAPGGFAAASNGVAGAIAEFTGGAETVEGDVLLELPEIADNGGSVPVRIRAEGARRMALFADGNPNPGIAVFTFGSLAVPAATVRVRLARSQEVIAVAEMADGSWRRTSRHVAVTVGGCG